MSTCTAKIQYSNGKQCQRESLPGKSKCAAHGSGGPRTPEGKARIAASLDKGKNESRARRKKYQQAVKELYDLCQLIRIPVRGRPPK